MEENALVRRDDVTVPAVIAVGQDAGIAVTDADRLNELASLHKKPIVEVLKAVEELSCKYGLDVGNIRYIREYETYDADYNPVYAEGVAFFIGASECKAVACDKPIAGAGFWGRKEFRRDQIAHVHVSSIFNLAQNGTREQTFDLETEDGVAELGKFFREAVLEVNRNTAYALQRAMNIPNSILKD